MLLATALFAPLMLGGCATSATPDATREREAQTLASVLQKGMTPEEVRALLGEPVQVRPVQSPAGKAERWVYRRRGGQVVNLQQTSTQDVPFVDPITGETRTMAEPVYSHVTTTVIEETHLLWVNGRLETWETLRRGEHDYQQ
jgi:hypothetical protein